MADAHAGHGLEDEAALGVVVHADDDSADAPGQGVVQVGAGGEYMLGIGLGLSDHLEVAQVLSFAEQAVAHPAEGADGTRLGLYLADGGNEVAREVFLRVADAFLAQACAGRQVGPGAQGADVGYAMALELMQVVDGRILAHEEQAAAEGAAVEVDHLCQGFYQPLALEPVVHMGVDVEDIQPAFLDGLGQPLEATRGDDFHGAPESGFEIVGERGPLGHGPCRRRHAEDAEVQWLSRVLRMVIVIGWRIGLCGGKTKCRQKDEEDKARMSWHGVGSRSVGQCSVLVGSSMA